MKKYKEIEAKADFGKLEEEVLSYWKEDDTFKKSIKNREKSDEFVFYDGPPFANGLPHYGHLLTGYVKDIVPRYQTMRGHKVDRRFGWDCHGLPAELDAEKFLGFSGRGNVMKYGIDKFNNVCRERVLKYTNEWQNTVNRQARWVDFENGYKTMNTSYMESLIWAFKQLYQKGLVYEGVYSIWYSYAAETPVSNFETRLDDSYRERDDTAVTVMFELKEQLFGKPIKILAWTTTPWTLPSNFGLAMGADIDYEIYEEEGVQYVIGKECVAKYKQQLKNATHVKTVKGSLFVEKKYEPLFPFFKDSVKNAFRVINADFVTTEDGTGTVHLAPFGEDDLKTFRKFDFDWVAPVDLKGCFTDAVPPYAGKLVFDCNDQIVKDLKEQHKLVKKEVYRHSYPHCWRTRTPLINMPLNSWYVDVPKFRERMCELNKQITWIPEHIRDGQFGKWLEGAREWSISRMRFWGTPIPVWKSTDPKYPRVDVYGSIAELEKDFGVKVTDLHRPFIDTLTRPNPDDPTGKSMMVRVEDVFDCWFESGSMPFAQVHYPFENKEWFEKHFPADFIVEYIAQTRGWFYTMMLMATALFDKPPFKTCMCHGVVLDENNMKLSKSLRNYPDPYEVFNKQGSDSLRWFLVSSPILKGGNLSIDKEGKEIAKSTRKAILPLWNAYYFFTIYANADGIDAKEVLSSDDVLDRYILSKLKELRDAVTELMDKHDIVETTSKVEEFLEILNNWYIRRSRQRFWSSKDFGVAAFDTLYTVLLNICKIMAPLAPMITEYVYRNLTGEESVHLVDWPALAEIKVDADLIAKMDFVRLVSSNAKAVREDNRLRNRLPLKSMTIAGENTDKLSDFLDILKDEINVKDVVVEHDVSLLADKFLYVKTPLVGKRLPKFMKDIIAASKSGAWSVNADGTLAIAGQTLSKEEFEMRLVLKEGTKGQALPDNTAVVVLDTTLYPELIKEGLARDFVRGIQSLRKEKDFDVSDRIDLVVDTTDAELKEVINSYADYIKEQVLAKNVSFAAVSSGDGFEIGDGTVKVSIKVVG